MERYGFGIFWSEEDGGFIATCPDFPGLSAFGESEEDALKEAKQAVTLFLDSMQSEGKRAPRATTMQKLHKPTRRPARLQAAG
jgi:predicted RNase H-like HicB family nuclease